MSALSGAVLLRCRGAQAKTTVLGCVAVAVAPAKYRARRVIRVLSLSTPPAVRAAGDFSPLSGLRLRDAASSAVAADLLARRNPARAGGLAALYPFRMKRQPQALRLGVMMKGFLATKTLIGSAF